MHIRHSNGLLPTCFFGTINTGEAKLELEGLINPASNNLLHCLSISSICANPVLYGAYLNGCAPGLRSNLRYTPSILPQSAQECAMVSLYRFNIRLNSVLISLDLIVPISTQFNTSSEI